MTSHNFFAYPRFRMASIGVIAAAALALSGCNSGSDPNNAGTTSPSASPTNSSTPSATPTPASDISPAIDVMQPSLPAAASNKTRSGLEEFTKYYVELLEYAYSTGDVDRLKRVNSPACSSCAGPVGDVQNAYTNGGWVVGGDLQVTATATSFLASDSGAYFVTMSIKQGRTAYYSGPGVLRKDVPAPAEEASMQLTASYVSGAWQVDDFSPPKGL